MNSAVPFTADDFADVEIEQARERYIRSVACLGVNERICGIEVKPLCMAHISLLRASQSPFLMHWSFEKAIETLGQENLQNYFMLFMWIVSPHYEQGSTIKTRWWQRKTARDRFNESVAPIASVPLPVVYNEIMAYMDEAFIDAEESPAGEIHKSFYAEEISIAYEFAKFGWRIDFWNADCPQDKNPMLVPLKIVFQLRKARAQAELGKDASLSNRSDRLVAVAQVKIGERHRRHMELMKRMSDPLGPNAIYGIYSN